LLCAVAAIDLEVERSRYQKVLVPLLTGFLCAVGLFVRFTFVIFALPIVLATLSRRFATAGASSHSKMKSVLSCIIWIAIPFLVASSFFVYHDFKFYSLQSSHSVETDASITTTQLENFWKYVAPWNAFRYNAKMENLADHGLHPRITHVLVNFPMLFGLIAISFYVTLSKKLVGDKHSKQSPLDRMLHGVILFGLGILSCAPHQEPRFLLPLIIPLILLHGRDLVELGRYGNVFLVLWIGFNVILMAFFGLMHQGAVVSSVMSLPDILRQAPLPQGVVIYYNTYMPPTFLLRRHPSNHLITPPYNHENARDTCPDFFVFDAQSSTKTKLLELISKSSSCCGNKYHSSVHLIAPKGLCDELSDEFRCRELWSLFQISTENLPTVKAIQNLLEYSRLSVNVIEWVPPVCKSSQIT
jgi:phosphatidylinositol glycan class Z